MQPLIESNKSLRIRGAVQADLDAIVNIHLAAFHRSFTLSTLGPAFLRPYYDLVLNFKNHIFFVAEHENEMVGFAAGFLSPQLFYKTLKAAKRRFISTLLWAVLKNPKILIRILGGIRLIWRKSKDDMISSESGCHLCSLAVKPTFSNKGIGKALVYAFKGEARHQGASHVIVTTDAENNDAVNSFYKRLGFHCAQSYYRSRGRLINEYLLQLDVAEDSRQIGKAA
jgi:ribosomal protein S18 acetylase RimI-like enzyme